MLAPTWAQLLGFVAFLATAHAGLVHFVFRFSTYHRYFRWAALLVIAYAAVVAWVLFRYVAPGFFLWYIGLEAAWLRAGNRRLWRLIAGASVTAIDRADDRYVAVVESLLKTIRFHKYSSILYLTVVATTYLILFNAP